MKKHIFYFGISLITMISACKKSIPGYTSDEYAFDITASSDSIQLADSISFFLTNNPDVISFYSGELGHVYDYRNRTILEGGVLQMKFETRVVNKLADTLDVMISNDFTGVYDSASVYNATWKKMTGFFTFPDALTPLSTFIPSGMPAGNFTNISDSVIPGKPFYLAFKYVNTKPTNIEWSVGKLGMYNFFTNGVPNATVIDSTTNNSGTFAEVKMNDAVNRWSKTSTLYKCTNSTTEPIGAEHWYISRPLNPSAVAPDVPVILKNISQNPLNLFKYKYNASGTYEAVFVASYSRLNFEKTFIKKVKIVVE